VKGNLKYVLDADVFIQAARQYYAFDLVPRFWDILISLANSGRILSIDRVKEELVRGKDELAEWAKKKFDHAFASTDDPDVIRSYGEVMSWVQAQSRFTGGAKAQFANGADGWLVAFAKLNALIVVTHEQPAPGAVTTVKIPDVSHAFKVETVDTFEMLRSLKERIT
jgi:hypothetical protein